MIHCRLDVLKCRSRWIDGSATLTMDASSTTMNWPTRTMLRRSQDGTLLPGAISMVVALSARMGAPWWCGGTRAWIPLTGQPHAADLYSHRTDGTPSCLAE